MKTCGYCTQFMPELKKYKKSGPKYKFKVVDISEKKNRKLAQKFKVNGVPIVKFIVDGEEKETFKGPRTSEALIKWQETL